MVGRSRVGRITPSIIESLLGLSAVGSLIIFSAASITAFSFPPRPSAEGTPQIPPLGVAGIGEKPNFTRATEHHAGCQFGPMSEIVERGLIQLYKRNNTYVTMPSFVPGDEFPQSDAKKTRSSVIIWIVLSISSFYVLVAFVARRELGIFSFFGSKYRMANHVFVSRLRDPSIQISGPIGTLSLNRIPDEDWDGCLEKKHPQRPRVQTSSASFFPS
jgi:hypothetical protein